MRTKNATLVFVADLLEVLTTKLNYSFSEFVTGVAIEQQEQNLKISVTLREGQVKIPRAVQNTINRITNRLLQSRGQKFTYKVMIADANIQSAATEMPQPILKQLIENLAQFSNIQLKTWEKDTCEQDYADKLLLLQNYITNAVFPPAFKANFPHLCNSKSLLKEINLPNVFLDIIDTQYPMLCKYVSESNSKHTSRLKYYQHNYIFKKQFNGSEPLLTWANWQLLQTLFIDAIEDKQEIINRLNKCVKQLTIILTSYHTFLKIFTQIPESERWKILGSDLNTKEVPNFETTIIECKNKVHELIVSLDEHIIRLQKSLTTIQSQLANSENILPKVSLNQDTAKTSNRANRKNTSTSSKQKNTTTTTTTITTSTTILSPSTTLTFFPTENLLSNSNSVTLESKRVALEKIKKNEAREKLKRERVAEETSLITPALTEAEHDVQPIENDIIYITCHGETLAAEIVPLAKTKHLYLCCQNDTIVPREKFQAFQEAALLGCDNLLTQGSLGANGIKLYGLNCLIVKCKQFPKEHLLAFACPIANSQDYVYLFEGLVSHQEYEKLLNNPALLEERANRFRATMTISTSEKTNDNTQKLNFK